MLSIWISMLLTSVRLIAPFLTSCSVSSFWVARLSRPGFEKADGGLGGEHVDPGGVEVINLKSDRVLVKGFSHFLSTNGGLDSSLAFVIDVQRQGDIGVELVGAAG